MNSDVSQTRESIQSIISEMQNAFYERDRIIRAAWASLLSGQHMLLLGVPGTAKSLLVQALCSRIQDAHYFQWLLTRFSVPEELFGPVSLKGMENDDYRRITDGKLPQSNIAFVDEIFKGNAAILNSLLTIINERKFDNGRQRMEVPLISMFGASNELPQEEELSALYDRFILRFDVPYIQDGSNWEELMLKDSGEPHSHGTTVTLADLDSARSDVRNVQMTKSVVDTMREIKIKLEREGLVSSDRRWKQTTTVLRAWAWLDGRYEVDLSDLNLLCDMLWHEPEQRHTIVSVVLAITNPLDLKATQIYDDMNDVYSKWDKMDSASTNETAEKIRVAMTKLDETIRTSRPDMLVKTKEVRQTLGNWYREVINSINV